MKSLVKAYAKAGLWLEEIDVPKINENEVLIKIKQTAICGTDLHIYNWDEWAQNNIPVPMNVGHEFVGEIVEIGNHVTKNLKIGQRVSGEGHIVCENCRNCRAGKKHLCPNTKGIGVHLPGAFAEYLKLPASNVFTVPDFISNNIASMLDPLGNAVHTALSFDCTGEDVLVTGAGPIGIMIAAICRHIGARHVVITDTNQIRLDLAKYIKDITTVNIRNESISNVMKKLNMKEGFDIGLEASGNESALLDMTENMLSGGKIALLGLFKSNITIDINSIILKGIVLKSIYGREMYETWYKMQNLLEGGLNVNPIITDILSYKDFNKGFEKMNSGKCGKVILDWEN